MNQTEYLNELSKKYKVSCDLFLLKLLLQLGIIIKINVNYINNIMGEKYIYNNYNRLVHPFVYRKEFVSSFRIITIIIDEEDIEIIRNKSENEELLLLDKLLKFYASPPSCRTLSY